MESGFFENYASLKELGDCLKAFVTILHDTLHKLE
jgi:hypothetical protein